MKRFIGILCAILAISMLCAVPAFASEEAPAEPSVFDVNIFVNGTEYATAPVGASVDVNVYTFNIEELLEAFGFGLEYDEETDTAALTAREGTIAAVLFCELQNVEAAEEEPESAAPVGSVSEEPPAVGSKKTLTVSAVEKNVPNARPAASQKAVREAPERKLPNAIPNGWQKPVRNTSERKLPNARPAAMEKQYQHDSAAAFPVRTTAVKKLPSAIPTIRQMLTYG